METVSGCVEHIVYRNEENGYTVFHLSCEEYDEITCVGNIPFINEGEFFDVSGEFIEHPSYGHQLKIKSAVSKRPDDVVSIERYLASGAVKGIGPKLAELIVKRFGDDTFRVIEEEPELLAEIRGISMKKAMDISVQVDDKRDMRSAMMFLQDYGVPNSLAAKVYEKYGPDLYEIIRTNPYRLAEDIEGVGFRTADDIAMKSGIEPDSEFRTRSGIIYCLQLAAGEGHVYLPVRELLKRLVELLGSEAGECKRVIQDLALDRKIVLIRQNLQKDKFNKITNIGLNGENDRNRKPVANCNSGSEADTSNSEDGVPDESCNSNKLFAGGTDGPETVNVYLAGYYHTEIAVARMLVDLNVSYPFDPSDVERIRRIEAEENITLDDMQRTAVTEAIRNGLMVITGGPGTGKTTIINTIIKFFKNDGKEVVLAAPTGRAARRMSEATGEQARTIHRLLEVAGIPGSGENSGSVSYDRRAYFQRNSDNPLEADVIIIDEMSMVDIHLMHSLLDAIIPGTRLILVGDINQLPSVGAGSVLKDIIASHEFNVVRLTKIFRQAAMSDIIVNAHRINDGERINLDNKSRDFFFLRRDDVNMIISNIITLVRDKLPSYVDAPMSEIQVLTPMRKGMLGVERLNRILQEYLNPPSPQKAEYTRDDVTFRTGDKVMQVKNDYELTWEIKGYRGITVAEGSGVFNGDTGIIADINRFDESLVVIFDENKEVTYSFSNLENLELAYAVTVHKSQGSEYPAVILPLLSGPRLLFNRNLLYTAVTRAVKCVTILGSEDTVNTMIDNVSEAGRYTSLDERIREIAE